ncbi:hypothetical protein [Microbacterium sp. SORGH_AS_0862]|uniref:hypothetical protein n=1 Tax=Microbacterium sp. SORGH_AS_0862 TaxID=3041789 RepID=UPI0027946DB3|nr:hypothetical protein [Microbacterium sp. SORGH_AS_0862]MDQ1204865.1 hypothetical protein [Microbacterium sp. SORGH_AS_0862]
MPIGTFAIVLLAAFAHAGWNLASKFKRGDTILFVGAYTFGSAILCAPLALWFAAAGIQSITPALIGASAVSAALHAGYSLALQAGYDRAAFGVVYPVARGSGPLLSMGSRWRCWASGSGGRPPSAGCSWSAGSSSSPVTLGRCAGAMYDAVCCGA